MKPTNRMWLAVGLACDFVSLPIAMDRLSEFMEENAIGWSAVYCMIVECAEKLAAEIDKQHSEDKNLELDYYLIIEAAAPLLHEWVLKHGEDVEYKGKTGDWTDLVQKAVEAGNVKLPRKSG